MSGWSARARTLSKFETRSEMLTISCTPAARARSMAASRSSSYCGACRLTWLSISMGGLIRPLPNSRTGGLAELRKGREERVGAVEVQRLHLARKALERLPRLRPRIKPAEPLAGLVDRHGMHPLGQPVEQQRELGRPLSAAE